ncbi:unnamed protein product [Schistosoma mattheei]|uniref:Uncharacterized protein n=1 Tax=Schistosoma mattheei TaxID=31246 RepID=A0AA85AZT3_9TREM|nr:unnamed protein product [Schistosoma mattheei]
MSFKYLQLLLVLTLSINSQIADPPIVSLFSSNEADSVATDEPSQGLVSDFFQWLFSLFSSNEADSGNSGSHP